MLSPVQARSVTEGSSHTFVVECAGPVVTPDKYIVATNDFSATSSGCSAGNCYNGTILASCLCLNGAFRMTPDAQKRGCWSEEATCVRV